MKFIITGNPVKILSVLIIHIFLGLLMIFAPKLIILWYYTMMLYVAYFSLKERDSGYIILFLAYSLGIEILGRMVDLSPDLPWELTKYLTPVVFLVILLMDGIKKSNMILGLIIVLISIPAWLLGSEKGNSLIFAMMGIINVGLLVAIFYNRKISLPFLLGIFRVVLFPLISILVFITIKAPSFSDEEFSLGANFDVTGGFGSNQISTILGIGFFLFAVSITIQKTLFVKAWIDISLAGYFLFRGLLSFSRGGVLVAVLAYFAVFYFLKLSNKLKWYNLVIRKINMQKIIMILGGLLIVFILANNITNGLLLLRYQGETGGTLRGTKEKDLNTLTTGRWEILVSDLEMWGDNIFWGVGGGNSSSLRSNYGLEPIVSHVEFSRILAEQGIFGLMILIIISFILPFNMLTNRNSVERAFLIAFFILGFLTSFHAAMRTFTTPFFIGLSTIRIIPGRFLIKRR